MVDFGLYFSYVLFFVGLIAAVLFPLVDALKSPKNLVQSGMSFGILLILFFVSYSLSDSNVTEKYVMQGIDEGGSKVVGAGLIMFYILFSVALIGIIFSEISKTFK